jgi:hypothetical protein
MGHILDGPHLGGILDGPHLGSILDGPHLGSILDGQHSRWAMFSTRPPIHRMDFEHLSYRLSTLPPKILFKLAKDCFKLDDRQTWFVWL